MMRRGLGESGGGLLHSEARASYVTHWFARVYGFGQRLELVGLRGDEPLSDRLALLGFRFREVLRRLDLGQGRCLPDPQRI